MTPEILENLRADYRSSTLTENKALDSPFAQFDAWFSEALKAEVKEPNAMTLATADLNGQPFARTVLLKGSSPEGFLFYTNYESNKGKEINANHKVALLFAWIELERQVRITGEAQKLDRRSSENYFKKRPRASQIAAIISPQSQVIPDRAFLDNKWRHFNDTHLNDQLALPEHWGGFLVVPHSLEFWQGRSNRLHDRLLYSRLNDTGWTKVRLAP